MTPRFPAPRRRAALPAVEHARFVKPRRKATGRDSRAGRSFPARSRPPFVASTTSWTGSFLKKVVRSDRFGRLHRAPLPASWSLIIAIPGRSGVSNDHSQSGPTMYHKHTIAAAIAIALSQVPAAAQTEDHLNL